MASVILQVCANHCPNPEPFPVIGCARIRGERGGEEGGRELEWPSEEWVWDGACWEGVKGRWVESCPQNDRGLGPIFPMF